jgi:D-arabinose 1-dehydrogenase-like Zn-dependent alcohol dehydrogenase
MILTVTLHSPLVPGHEIIGRIVGVGEGVSGWKTGDRVGGAWHGGHDGEFSPSL